MLAARSGWHEGERKLHRLLDVPRMSYPSNPGLTAYASRLLEGSSLLAVGAMDQEGRPWTTIIGGEPGFAKAASQSVVAVKTVVDRRHDPVISALLGRDHGSESDAFHREERMMSALGIHLATRERVKLSGRTLDIAFETNGPDSDSHTQGPSPVQMMIRVDESLGNCPKYINQRQITPSSTRPTLMSNSLPLFSQSLELLAKADTFFISSCYHDISMDTNHRGGSPGFVRVFANSSSETVLVYPEYSGNRFYQTLGNLETTHKAGLVFPDFDTGNVLFLTAIAEIRHGEDAASVLPRSDLVVTLRVTAASFVLQGLSFRGIPGAPSPYNPPIRFLSNERKKLDVKRQDKTSAHAKLLARTLITPSIARIRFGISAPDGARTWQPGQYVVFDLNEQLSRGYDHMRDDDPLSINDDLIRTFTVSSRPCSDTQLGEFEITIRKIGKVTNFLFSVAELDVSVNGFGGSFFIEQKPTENVSFVAGGVGITPLLSQLPDIDVSRLHLFWTINVQDCGFVKNIFDQYPRLAAATTVFISGVDTLSTSQHDDTLRILGSSAARIFHRRISAHDVQVEDGIPRNYQKWYLCVGTSLRKSLLDWLSSQNTFFEDFNY